MQYISLAHFAPIFLGLHNVEEKKYMVMANLLHGTSRPHVMVLYISLVCFPVSLRS